MKSPVHETFVFLFSLYYNGKSIFLNTQILITEINEKWYSATETTTTQRKTKAVEPLGVPSKKNLHY